MQLLSYPWGIALVVILIAIAASKAIHAYASAPRERRVHLVGFRNQPLLGQTDTSTWSRLDPRFNLGVFSLESRGARIYAHKYGSVHEVIPKPGSFVFCANVGVLYSIGKEGSTPTVIAKDLFAVTHLCMIAPGSGEDTHSLELSGVWYDVVPTTYETTLSCLALNGLGGANAEDNA